jgi:hypothetical protein
LPPQVETVDRIELRPAGTIPVTGRDIDVLWTLAVNLAILWALGLATNGAGAFIHLLLAVIWS